MNKMSLGKIILSGLLSTSLLLNVACNKDNDDDKLNAQLAEKNKKMQDLEAEKAQQQKALDAQIEANKENVEKFKALEASLNEKEKALKDLQAIHSQQISEHQEMIDGQEVTITEKNIKITELESEVSNIKNEMSALELAVQKKQQELEAEFVIALEKNALADKKMENAIQMEEAALGKVKAFEEQIETLKEEVAQAEARKIEIERNIKDGIEKADLALQEALTSINTAKIQQADVKKALEEAKVAQETAILEQGKAATLKSEALAQKQNLETQVSLYKDLFAGIEAQGVVDRILEKDTKVTALISLYGVDEPLKIFELRKKVAALNKMEDYKNNVRYSPSKKEIAKQIAAKSNGMNNQNTFVNTLKNAVKNGPSNAHSTPLVNDRYLVQADSSDILALRDSINKDKSNKIFLIVRPINKVNVSVSLEVYGRKSEMLAPVEENMDRFMKIDLGDFDRSKLVELKDVNLHKPETYIFGEESDVCKQVDYACLKKLREVAGITDSQRMSLFQLFEESKSAIDLALNDDGELVQIDEKIYQEKRGGRVVDGLSLKFEVSMINPIPSDGRIYMDWVFNRQDRITEETIKQGFIPIKLPLETSVSVADFHELAEQEVKKEQEMRSRNGREETVTAKWKIINRYQKWMEIQQDYRNIFQ
ncbi:MAG: hypothetical protein CL674_11685 [Bdellovibrionaceae bacterium]|nr:hypothetical protein [Pseudobdellovibrionaceae bacterium]|tara:strand:+ start:30980 stop:32938 length:1959 start_codon:yes stop_codon:yes gene_type:complete